ncbi:GTPase HflX [Ruminococcus sp. HUN007]|uniref:GTPase HflX n=1 Tax=Ruminococcus sp. HUN007 TaxID=1514668 RepID=UPI0005D23216|nr:GTPase HflX [Ruminococcus sp. HUN007]
MDQETKKTKVILAAVDTGEYDIESSLAELEELAKTADGEVVGVITQKKPAFDPGFCMGAGRLEELADICKELETELIVFDHELSATQIRNIEDITDVRVIDRTMLILDIFAARARTSEGKLQVELALQKYRLPRLTGMGVEMSRLGGGIGTRGPGETKLETDRRHIKRRITALEEELRNLGERRKRMRARRKKDSVLTAAIVGYTNVGKSTLLNALTEAGVLAENKLFATLDTTSRSIELPDGRSVMLIDTVGLIRRLPHSLVEAFKSTLEEAAEADLIIEIIDSSSPEAAEQIKVTHDLLAELGCEETPHIYVLNKCDKGEPLIKLPSDVPQVRISAINRTGFDELLSLVVANLPETLRKMKLLIPYSQTGLTGKIRENGRVINEEYAENGVITEALVDIRLQKLCEQYLTE